MKKVFLAVFLILVGLIAPGACIVKSIQFNQQCAGYLKQAADANSAELSLERLNLAIDYVEKHGLTDGYTSVLWKTEDENIGYWYRNLKTCQSELEGCLEASQLEKSNVLMKVRESLTDDSKDGTSLTIPFGMSRYPNNGAWGLARFISYLLILAGLCLWTYAYENEY